MARKPKNLYLRGGIYWARVKVTGHEYRGSLRTTDPREAARRVKAWRLKLERAAVGDTESPSFKPAVVRWAKEVLPNSVKPSVQKRYLVSIGQLADTFGELRINRITSATIADYISRRTQVASNATVRRDLTALSRLLSACVSWGWATPNPARFYDRSIIREKRDPIHPPSAEQVNQLIVASPPGMAAILRLLDQQGCERMRPLPLRHAM